MKASAYVHHQIPGRVRLKIPAHRGDAAYFERLASQIGSYPGIVHAYGNPQTASLLIEHGGNFADISNRAATDDLFEIVHDTLAPVVEAGQSPVTPINQAAQSYRLPAKPQFLPALAVGFAGLGVYQLFRRQVLAPATTLFWYALSAMIVAAAKKRSNVAPPM